MSRRTLIIMRLKFQVINICAVTAQLINIFGLAAWIVQCLFFFNPNFQASNLLLWLHRLVCVGPGRKLPKSVFLCRGLYQANEFSVRVALQETSKISLISENFEILFLHVQGKVIASYPFFTYRTCGLSVTRIL